MTNKNTESIMYDKEEFIDYDMLVYARQGMDGELIDELRAKIVGLSAEVDALKTRLMVYENKLNILTKGSVN